MKPLRKYTLPDSKSQNSFGAKRKFDYHTGIDLFCDEGDEVYSMFDGVVTNVIKFTGFEESPWWNDTYAVMIYHHTIQKTFLYGEITPVIKAGKVVKAGDVIGNVTKVLKKDKGLPTTMLHMECYKGLQTDAVWWYHNNKQPKNLEDITKYMKRVVILGGGTFEPIRNHLALSAPAFGSTAKHIHKLITGSELILTKMADSSSNLKSNSDVEKFIDELIEDKTVGTIVLNVAFCDFKAMPIDGVESGFHADRLKTAEGNLAIELTPTDKVISKIRLKRPDIFLVGFKTTTSKTSEDQFLIALQMMKKTKCNLVLANDTVTRNNMVITPEETIYGETTDRDSVLKELTDMILLRNNLTYNPSIFNNVDSTPIESTPENFQKTIDFLLNNGGYIENNGNGFTPGHFCYKLDDKSFLSSQRKANHNLVFKEGMSKVDVENNEFVVSGKRKASVGARSQWLILQQNPGYDCIIHTHNPLKSGSEIPIAEQRPFQCGSLECGLNTVNNMKEFDGIKAVYLDKHGANILFKSKDDFKKITTFVQENIELGTKVK